jgi:hypothetical protein
MKSIGRRGGLGDGTMGERVEGARYPEEYLEIIEIIFNKVKFVLIP